MLPLFVALAVGFLQYRDYFRVSDARFYDFVTLREPGTPPRVVIVRSDPAFEARGAARNVELVRITLKHGALRVAFRQDPLIDPAQHGLPMNRIVVSRAVEPVPGTRHWRLTGPAPAAGVTSAAKVLAAAEHGIHRRQLGSLPGADGAIPVFESAAAGQGAVVQAYLLRLSRRQNLPRIEASQLIGGEIDLRALAGAVVLVEPPTNVVQARVVTARDPAAAAMTLTDYNAAAIQTLMTGRGARALGSFAALLILLSVGAIVGAIYLRADPKRIVLLLLAASFVIVLGGASLLINYANLLLPVSGLIIAQLISAVLVLHRAEVDEDRNLRRFVTQTINLSSRQVLLKDLGRLPGFLAASVPMLGIARFALFEAGRGRHLEILAEHDATLEQFGGDRRQLRALLRRARRARQPIEAGVLLPDWPGPVRLAALGRARGEVYWLYGFAPQRAHSAALHAAAAMATEYRAIQQLRSDLSAGSDRSREYRPADEWAGGAVKLITGHGDQISGGLDALETAVMVFHPIGFPVHANEPMGALYDSVGLALAEATLPELLAALTDLDPTRIAATINDLLLHGGEIRVNCRDIGARMRQLRVAATHAATSDRPRTIVVEATDVTEPHRLAQLRLTVSNLLDVNIRNDLDAIGFATALARDSRVTAEGLTKILGQIDRAAARATARLEEMAPHLRDDRSGGDLKQAFPINAAEAMREACDLVAPMARELGTRVEIESPEISGYTIADPRLLIEMAEAMLRIVIADVPTGDPVKLQLHEGEQRTQLTISGGIGMAFERLYAALESAESQAPGPFRAISRGMAAALGWGAMVSYSSSVGKGYRFVIDMRRIG